MVKMVIHFEKLSKAVDAYNAHRIESEQVEYWEIAKSIENPLDPVEVLTVITELYEEIH